MPVKSQASPGVHVSVPATSFYVSATAEGYDKVWLGPFEPHDAANGELVGTNYERKFIAEGREVRGMTLVKR